MSIDWIYESVRQKMKLGCDETSKKLNLQYFNMECLLWIFKS